MASYGVQFTGKFGAHVIFSVLRKVDIEATIGEIVQDLAADNFVVKNIKASKENCDPVGITRVKHLSIGYPLYSSAAQARGIRGASRRRPNLETHFRHECRDLCIVFVNGGMKAFGNLPTVIGTLNMNNIKLATFDVGYFMGHVEIDRLLMDSSGIKYIHPVNTTLVQKGNVPLIKELTLNFNILSNIPRYALRGFEKLQVLNLQGNRISSINNESFCGLHALVDLSLFYNKINSLPRASFACASNLTNIDLSHNNLATLDPRWFDGSLYLRSLVIDQSAIRRITVGPWKTTNLQTLVLKNNDLHSLSHNTFNGLANLKTLDVSGNFNLFQMSKAALTSVGSLESLVMTDLRQFTMKAIVGYHEITEDRTAEDYEFQLNLMFHDGDEWWVNDCMKPFLEQRMPHLGRVIFGDADLHPGSFYLNAIYDVIENSHKTMLLLSNRSVDDTWYMTKLRMAVEHMNDTKLEKVILIFLEDIDDDHLPYLVRLLLSRNEPYLLLTEDEEGQEVFWAKIQKSMRSNRQMNNVIPV
ncbi:uncharacterized protein LOC115923186 [Strongylocentrotus purpuratus]|uniref:TIR domain-containing protein n=1 Tax=Strongylocentrotus purpuratus TaxID=7668 RepID=A0A7M7SXW5_STRPU|nr:uncharacterized protein LOC115923186 [Strongylocentrotus purpuratus]